MSLGNVVIIGFRERSAHKASACPIPISSASKPPGARCSRRLRDQSSDNFLARLAAENRQLRIAQNLARKRRAIRRSAHKEDWRRSDHIRESRIVIRSPAEFERGQRGRGGRRFRARARARPPKYRSRALPLSVGAAARLSAITPLPVPTSRILISGLRISGLRNQKFHQLLRLRPRNQRAFIAKKTASAKFHRPEQMLQRLTLAASPNEFTQRRQFRFAERPIEIQIKLDPLPSQRVREQMLGIQARTLDAALLKIRACGLKNLQDRLRRAGLFFAPNGGEESERHPRTKS